MDVDFLSDVETRIILKLLRAIVTNGATGVAGYVRRLDEAFIKRRTRLKRRHRLGRTGAPRSGAEG